MGTVASLNSALATAYGNARRIDRTQNGVLWGVFSQQGGLSPYYSTDNGATWTQTSILGATGASYPDPRASIFIDLDDYAHVVMKDPSDGYIKYYRGTPNAARTAYTWSTATVLRSDAAWDYPDIVAFRDPAVAGAWVAFVVMTPGGSSAEKASIKQINISSAGAATITPSGTALTPVSATLGAANSNPGYPSIDFNHTGDGKTVAGGTPHLYVGWSAGATGAGYGIRFRKATYSSGSWAWATEREIDSAHYYTAGAVAQCAFDGTRVIISGAVLVAAGNAVDLVLHERDAADTTTTPRTLIAGTSSADQGTTYDPAGNVYFIGRDSAIGSQALVQRKWTRLGATLSAPATLDNATSGSNVTSVRRGPQGQAIDYVYTDGTTSPYTVTSGRIVLNQNPTAPTPVSPADNATWDSSTDQTVTLKPNDPDGDAASKVRIRYRPAGTSVPYAYLESTTAVPAGGTATVTVPANTWDGVIEYASQSYDPSNAEGAWSPTRVVTGIPAALAAATGGQGGTSLPAASLLNMVQSERALRALSLV